MMDDPMMNPDNGNGGDEGTDQPAAPMPETPPMPEAPTEGGDMGGGEEPTPGM